MRTRVLVRLAGIAAACGALRDRLRRGGLDRRFFNTGFYLASTAAFEVRAYGPDGTLERIVRGPETSRPLASGGYAAAVDSLVQSWGGTDSARGARVRRIYEDIPAPDADGVAHVRVHRIRNPRPPP